MRLMTNGESSPRYGEPDTIKDVYNLRRLTDLLFGARIRHWDDAFIKPDAWYQTYVEGMGEVRIKHLRDYEHQLLLHRRVAAQKRRHEIHVLEHKPGEIVPTFLIDGVPVILIHPYLHLTVLDLLTEGFVGEDTLIEHGLRKSDLARDLDFLNSNFSLGLKLNGKVEDDRVILTVSKPKSMGLTL